MSLNLKSRIFAGVLTLLSVISASSQTTADKTKKETPPPREESRPQPRPEPKPEPRPEPKPEPRSQPRQESRPEVSQEEKSYQAPRQEQPREQPVRNNGRTLSGGEYRPAAPAAGYRQTAPLGEHEYHYSLGANHPGTRIILPDETPAFRRARVYNTRNNGLHITPEYFAANFGVSHPVHFPSTGSPYFVPYRGEWYCQVNGAYFGVMGPLPNAWNTAIDNLYIDIGDDGNYYLYDSAQPDFAIQLTYVQRMGDDQADYPDSGNPDQ